MEYNTETTRYIQDKLQVRNFLTADALKNAIRYRIKIRLQKNWGLCTIKDKGAYIALIFVQNTESLPTA